MESPALRIKRITEVLTQHVELIYMEGLIPQRIWNILLDDAVLGRIAPNPAVGKAVLAQIQTLEDELLTGIILTSIETFKSKDKTYDSINTKAWMTSLKEVLLTKRPETIQEEGVMTSLERSATMGPSPSPLHNAKIDYKLKQYSGETNLCALWFWELEKSLKKLRINEGDYILHAINASSDKARTTICLLDDELQSDYDQILKKNL